MQLKKELGLTITLLILLIITINYHTVSAQQIPFLHLWTDKPSYKPGEEGKLFIAVHNNLGSDIFINKIVIEYPWYPSYIDGKWTGNDTIIPSIKERNLKYQETRCFESSFKIPSDSRVSLVENEPIRVRVFLAGFDTPKYESLYLTVDTVSSYNVVGLDVIFNLMIIQIILTVISAVIIAATINLSAKKLIEATPKPQFPFKIEEEEE